MVLITMTPLSRIIVLPTAIVLSILFSVNANKDTSSKSTNKSCAEIKCKDPPSNLKCTLISEKDNSASVAISKPKGKPEECCPLWKCKEENNNAAKSDVFTFHGVLGENKGDPSGGTEIVRYKSTRSGKGEPIFNVVSSMATGKHDAVAFASDTRLKGQDFKKEMENEFKSFGINI